MLHRIQEAQPVYSHVAWEESWRRSERHLRTACVYPVPACFFLFAQRMMKKSRLCLIVGMQRTLRSL